MITRKNTLSAQEIELLNSFNESLKQRKEKKQDTDKTIKKPVVPMLLDAHVVMLMGALS